MVMGQQTPASVWVSMYSSAAWATCAPGLAFPLSWAVQAME